MKATTSTHEDTTTLALEGAMDESANSILLEARRAAKGARVVIDLTKVHHFNSTGIGAFHAFVRDVSAVTSVEYVGASRGFLDICTVLPQFRVMATLVSAYLPFKCQGCAHEVSSLRELAALAHDRPAPTATCPKCHGAMRLAMLADDLADWVGLDRS